jgi:hypothetical protein
MSYTCRVCQLEKPEDEMVKFDKNICKECVNEYSRKRRQELIQKRIENPDEQKECSKCGILKNINEYDIGKNICNPCNNKKNRDRKIERAEQYINDKITEKQCIKCKNMVNIDDFGLGENTCKPCLREYAKNRKQELLQKYDLNEEKKCIKCEILKYCKDFEIGNNVCNPCRNLYGRQCINKTNKNFLRKLLSCAKTHAKMRTKRGRIEAGEISITLEDLESLYEKQNGLCYYSKVLLSLKTFSDWQCSLERLDPSKGYIIDNIALISMEFQHSSQWSITKYAEFIRLINIKHPKQNTVWNTQKDYKNRKKPIKIIEDGVEKCKCNNCEIFKTIDKFSLQSSKVCIECITNNDKICRDSPRSQMISILSQMKTSSIRRGFDPPEITLEDLFAIFDKQGGLCEYSGIPMIFGSYLEKHWTTSPERIDVKKGYTKDNLCFICYEFNTADRSRCATNQEEVTGSAGWNANKIEYIKSLSIK